MKRERSISTNVGMKEKALPHCCKYEQQKFYVIQFGSRRYFLLFPDILSKLSFLGMFLIMRDSVQVVRINLPLKNWQEKVTLCVCVCELFKCQLCKQWDDMLEILDKNIKSP